MPKSEVIFLLEKMPQVLKPNTFAQFLKLLSLYTDGIMSRFEFMSLVEDIKVSDAADDTLKQLGGIIAAREESRRLHNYSLMKPLSELDIKRFFTEKDHISKSYYKLPVDFPNPICSGRYLLEEKAVCLTLNDEYCSITTGSELFKAKIKQDYEDNLFKVEDAMYAFDHEILRLQSVTTSLERELMQAKDWN